MKSDQQVLCRYSWNALIMPKGVVHEQTARCKYISYFPTTDAIRRLAARLERAVCSIPEKYCYLGATEIAPRRYWQ
jgi:hypothetical protein